MSRIMKPDAVAVIGASAEDGKIGNSVMKNLINGGYQGEIYPINPSAAEIMGRKAYKSVRSEEHTSELQSQSDLVCRLLLQKKKRRNSCLSTTRFEQRFERRNDEIDSRTMSDDLVMCKPALPSVYTILVKTRCVSR